MRAYRTAVWTVAISLLLFAFAASAFAAPYTCDASGCTWNTGYTEPSKLTNNQNLTDLTSCTATYTTSVDGAAPGAPKSFTIAATAPTGGGVISRNQTDATMTPGHTYLISETIRCTSTSFGTSAASAASTLMMNNGVAPNPPAAPTLN